MKPIIERTSPNKCSFITWKKCITVVNTNPKPYSNQHPTLVINDFHHDIIILTHHSVEAECIHTYHPKSSQKTGLKEGENSWTWCHSYQGHRVTISVWSLYFHNNVHVCNSTRILLREWLSYPLDLMAINPPQGCWCWWRKRERNSISPFWETFYGEDRHQRGPVCACVCVCVCVCRWW